MAILKLAPSFKDYIWGGRRLIEEYHKPYEGDILAESWEVSCHPDGPSFVTNGAYAGKTLQEYIDLAGREVLGSNCRRFDEFPILIKFIDAKDNLSIQVHPDNAYALKYEHQYGKTEMWYVVDCEEGAYLYYGFNREVSKEEFAERIKNNTLLEVLNPVKVKKGDVLFIESGTIRFFCHQFRITHSCYWQEYPDRRDPAELQRDLPCLRLRPCWQRRKTQRTSCGKSPGSDQKRAGTSERKLRPSCGCLRLFCGG